LLEFLYPSFEELEFLHPSFEALLEFLAPIFRIWLRILSVVLLFLSVAIGDLKLSNLYYPKSPQFLVSYEP